MLDDRGIERAVLAGASMGAHTLMRFALDAPGARRRAGARHAGLRPRGGRERDLDRWDALSDGLRNGGVEGFVAAYGDPKVPEQWRDTIVKVLRQRLSAHEHPDAMADALRAVPRSRPFEAWDELAAIDAPTVVVASRDEADPEHPYAVGERYAEAIPGAALAPRSPAARRWPGRAGRSRG